MNPALRMRPVASVTSLTWASPGMLRVRAEVDASTSGAVLGLRRRSSAPPALRTRLVLGSSAWTADTLGAEFDAALTDFFGAETDQSGDDRVMSETDVELFSAWFHNDRRLPDGATPAERYALRPDLDAHERAAAERIASASLGIYRVLDVRPGEWIALEDLAGGTRTAVISSNVSGEATPWDLLIGRLMPGEPPGLWGSTRLLEPSDEPDLLAELARLGGGADSSPDGITIARALEEHPLEVIRFRPPIWDTTPTFFTAEGDLVVDASMTWQTRDPHALERRVRTLGGSGRRRSRRSISPSDGTR